MMDQDAPLPPVLEETITYEVERYIPPIKLQHDKPEEGEWWRTGWHIGTIEEAQERLKKEPAGKARIVEVVTIRREIKS